MPATLLRFPRSGAAETVSALLVQDGTASHPYPLGPALDTGPAFSRNIADVLHYLCVLHGRQSDIIDLASLRHPASSTGVFLTGAARAFAVERAYLARLTVAAGPMPSTPGTADCEAALKQQAHTLSMLADSDRHGTAFGAALALVMDWHAVRVLMDRAGERLGLPGPDLHLPGIAECLGAAAAFASSAALERAVAFGVQQFLAQQRGLWSLLEARAIARGDA